jgi:drug/metabolite transporter (DMT)-like permease
MAQHTTEGAIGKGLLITTFGGLLFTLDLPLLRLAEADKWTLVFARGMMLFFAITAVWYLARRRSSSKIPYLAGVAGLAVVATNTVANISYIGAIVETTAANVVFITALIPVITAIFSRLFLGETVRGWTWVAAALSFLGVAIIGSDGLQGGRILGDALALLSAICTAAAFTIIRASGKNVATSLALGSLISALVAAFVFPISPGSLFAATTSGVPGIIWVGLNGLIFIPLASTLIANGPRYLPSADVSMFFLLETVLTPVWIWMIFGEVPSGTVLVGGIIVILTLLTHSWWRLNVTLKSASAASATAGAE